ncbi:Ras- C3 botulinum toxin substrate 2 [Balamuthia mandrillaris]
MTSTTNIKTIKCRVVGNDGTGRTAMAVTFTSNSFPGDHFPQAFDCFSANLSAGEQTVKLELYPVAASDEYARLRPLSYPDTDVFLLCYSVASPPSFLSVEAKWNYEVQHHCPDVPKLLVGTKVDLRRRQEDARQQQAAPPPRQKNTRESDHSHREGEREESDRVEQEEQVECVSKEEGERMAKRIGAVQHLECSALTQEGLRELRDQVVKTALSSASSQSSSGGGKKEKKRFGLFGKKNKGK